MSAAPLLTDEAFLQRLGQRLAALRLSRNLTQGQLAEQAGVGLRTVQRLELGAAATQLSGFLRICRVLGLADRLESIVPEPQASPIALLERQGRSRQRASRPRTRPGSRGAPKPSQPWTWGDAS